MGSETISDEAAIPVQPDGPLPAIESIQITGPEPAEAAPALENITPQPRVFTDKELERREQIFDKAQLLHIKHKKAAERIIRIVNIRALSAVGLAAQNRAIRLQYLPDSQDDPH